MDLSHDEPRAYCLVSDAPYFSSSRVGIAMLSRWTWCARALLALVTPMALVTLLAGLPLVTPMPRVTLLPGLPLVTPMALLAGLAWVTLLSLLSLLAGLARVTLLAGLPLGTLLSRRPLHRSWAVGAATYG
jgi:hypothetical protein